MTFSKSETNSVFQTILIPLANIVITEDVTVIHGNVNLVELQEYFCLKIFRKIISFLSDPPITVSRTVYLFMLDVFLDETQPSSPITTLRFETVDRY